MASLNVLIFDKFVSGGKFGICARSAVKALFIAIVERYLTAPERVCIFGVVFSEAISLS